jgi:archaetidylinositol phosphate synthase
MVLGRKHTGLLGFLLGPLSRRLKDVDPNVITWASFPFAVLAGLFFFGSDPANETDNYFLIYAAIAVLLMGVLDLLDGQVARLSGRATLLGDFLDHAMDRFIDTLLIIAIAMSPWADLRVGAFALAGTLLTSYMGTQAQAVGAGRLYGGFLGRADRILMLIVAPVVDHFFVVFDFTTGWGNGADYALGLVLWFMAIAGFFTAAQRFVRIFLHLRRA